MRPTLSAASTSFASLSVIVAAIALAPAVAAQPGAPGLAPSPAPDTAPPPPAPPVLPRVIVTSVGAALAPAALESSLGPALRATYALHFSSADRFGPEELFRARLESTAAVHVWVDTTTPGLARLYFANRDGTRYLVRTLELSVPVDELDREALAQAIEWSLQALAAGTAGLTRAEAEALFADPAAPAPDAPAPPPQPGRPSDSHWRGAPGWLPEVALLHGWAPESRELIATQGPVLRLGLDRITRRHQVGLTASGQYRYPQRHAEAGVALEIESVSARLDVRALATGLVEGAGIGLRLGLGLDAVSATPEALDTSRLEAMAPRTSAVPLVGGGLVCQLRVEPRVRLELGVGAELDLVAVRYDVVTAAGTTELLARWPVRPSASVGVALF